MIWRLCFLLALLLPEVALDPTRADLPASLAHPLGCDALGRDGLGRLAVGAARSLGFASLAASAGLAGGTLLALVKGQWAEGVAVLRGVPALLILLPVAAWLDVRGWGALALLLGGLLAVHAEGVLRARLAPFREGPARQAVRVLGASPGRTACTWAPWAMGQVRPLFPGLWLEALWAEAALRLLGLGPGPETDSLGLLLQDELPRLVTDPSPLGIASMMLVVGLALTASPDPTGKDPS